MNNRRREYLLNNSLNVDSSPIGLTHIHSGSTSAISEVNELVCADKDVPVPFSRDIPVSVAPLTVHRCEASSPVNSGSQVEALTVVLTNVGYIVLTPLRLRLCTSSLRQLTKTVRVKNMKQQ
ncbi:unnamed protein product [Parnassius apollo]|uniref:(apollo) hypothetical protein n=1 Tax=Parnassius apollo TaxID=110799 RepID=A0A8S3WQ64_PARAO|nr:unnamed protein product [Parnassius apollo]